MAPPLELVAVPLLEVAANMLDGRWGSWLGSGADGPVGKEIVEGGNDLELGIDGIGWSIGDGHREKVHGMQKEVLLC